MFSELVAPMWAMVKATSKREHSEKHKQKSEMNLEWTADGESSFEECKEAIIKCTLARRFFNDDRETSLMADAGPNGLGAVLLQANDDGKNEVIAYGSKALTDTEKRYAHNQKEAYAVVWAVEHFRFYLQGRRFTIFTDAQGMAFIFSKKRFGIKTRAISSRDGRCVWPVINSASNM